MYKKDFESYINELSYEEQKELVYRLEDQQSYDDSCNAIEILIKSIGDCVIAIIEMLYAFKR